MSTREEFAGPVDLLDLHRAAPARYPFLLESVAGHPQSGRYDILFAEPDGSLCVRGGKMVGTGGGQAGGDFFECLSAWATECRGDAHADLPFAGGWFLFLGYEMGQVVEPRLHLPRAADNFPDALAVRCGAAVVRDRERNCCHVVSADGSVDLDPIIADLRRARTSEVRAGTVVQGVVEEPAARFIDGVARIHEYLRAGDVFQVNLSRGWSAQLAPGFDAADVYQRLRVSNPAPFAGIARWGASSVLSSSPERLVRIEGRRVETRPIAGTRPRGADAAADRRLREELVQSIKERAEHIMLIDLERNDLGRVCRPGSVEVSELMTVESYAHVHHIVSNVRGELRDGIGPGEVLKAVFPGGTITGCPKVRAMEIIAELEGEGRGPYTGAMGYLGLDGRLDMNILIRTLSCDRDRLRFRSGAGIVADSDAAHELAETRSKARGLLGALQ